MIEHFKEKFEKKTDQELLYIIDNSEKYNENAVLADKLILKWRKSMGVEIVPAPLKGKLETSTSNISSLNPKQFLKNINKQDFFTSFSVAFLWMSLQQVINLYQDEDYFEHISLGVTLLLIPIIFIINHSLYRRDHKRSNNYAGRVIHSVITLLCFIVIASIFSSFKKAQFEFFVTYENIHNILALVAVILFIEVVIGVLKHILKLLKWRIL